MTHTIRQMDDFVGRELDTIAGRMRRGVSPCDMETSIQQVVQLLCEKIHNPQPVKKSCGACCCQGH